VYAYEVDGLGNSLVDFDDPNIPSLLAIPELGYDGYNKEVSPSALHTQDVCTDLDHTVDEQPCHPIAVPQCHEGIQTGVHRLLAWSLPANTCWMSCKTSSHCFVCQTFLPSLQVS
jgi:hypothetical protein